MLEPASNCGEVIKAMGHFARPTVKAPCSFWGLRCALTSFAVNTLGTKKVLVKVGQDWLDFENTLDIGDRDGQGLKEHERI